jgi:biopolymer transport protein ExbD
MRNLREQLHEDEETEINLTPMLDVVFIMLIFFIVTAVFVKEPGAEVNRPDAQTAVPPDASTLFIAVTSANEIWIDRRSVDIDGVRAAIERLSAENPDGGVVIQADSEASNQYVISVMDSAKAAGVSNITLAATAP